MKRLFWAIAIGALLLAPARASTLPSITGLVAANGTLSLTGLGSYSTCTVNATGTWSGTLSVTGQNATSVLVRVYSSDTVTQASITTNGLYFVACAGLTSLTVTGGGSNTGSASVTIAASEGIAKIGIQGVASVAGAGPITVTGSNPSIVGFNYAYSGVFHGTQLLSRTPPYGSLSSYNAVDPACNTAANAGSIFFASDSQTGPYNYMISNSVTSGVMLGIYAYQVVGSSCTQEPPSITFQANYDGNSDGQLSVNNTTLDLVDNTTMGQAYFSALNTTLAGVPNLLNYGVTLTTASVATSPSATFSSPYTEYVNSDWNAGLSGASASTWSTYNSGNDDYTFLYTSSDSIPTSTVEELIDPLQGVELFVPQTMEATGTATSTTNYGSQPFRLQNSIWNGTSAVTNTWTLQGDNVGNLRIGYNGTTEAEFGPTGAVVNGPISQPGYAQHGIASLTTPATCSANTVCGTATVTFTTAMTAAPECTATAETYAGYIYDSTAPTTTAVTFTYVTLAAVSSAETVPVSYDCKV